MKKMIHKARANCFFCNSDKNLTNFIDGADGQTIYFCQVCADKMPWQTVGLETICEAMGLELGEYLNTDYEKAYSILMEYFDSISDEEKPKVHKALQECGL